MDRYYSSAISKESSDVYSIPNSTQHDARQRCPAVIVLKEENNNTTPQPLYALSKTCRDARTVLQAETPGQPL